jgi:hypothetical protein
MVVVRQILGCVRKVIMGEERERADETYSLISLRLPGRTTAISSYSMLLRSDDHVALVAARSNVGIEAQL